MTIENNDSSKKYNLDKNKNAIITKENNDSSKKYNLDKNKNTIIIKENNSFKGCSFGKNISSNKNTMIIKENNSFKGCSFGKNISSNKNTKYNFDGNNTTELFEGFKIGKYFILTGFFKHISILNKGNSIKVNNETITFNGKYMRAEDCPMIAKIIKKYENDNFIAKIKNGLVFINSK